MLLVIGLFSALCDNRDGSGRAMDYLLVLLPHPQGSTIMYIAGHVSRRTLEQPRIGGKRERKKEKEWLPRLRVADVLQASRRPLAAAVYGFASRTLLMRAAV